MSLLSGEVESTPSKRKLPLSSSDCSPISETALENQPKSKKQEKKRRKMNAEMTSLREAIDAINSKMDTIVSKIDTLATKESQNEMKADLNRMIGTLKTRVDKLEGELYEIGKKNDGLQNSLSAVKKQNTDLSGEVKALRERVRQNESKNNDLEQYGRRSHLRVFGVPEDRGDKESVQDCRKKVADIFQNLIKVPVGEDRIEVAHRTGSVAKARANNSTRPIIVRFLSREDRDTVIRNRKVLKGKKISVAEDLTLPNLRLLKRLEEHSGTMSSWSSNGKLFAKLKNGLIIKVDTTTDINMVINRGLKNGRESEGREHQEMSHL